MLTSNPTAQHSGQSSLIDGTKASGAKHIINLSEADWLDPEFPFAINLATYNLRAGKMDKQSRKTSPSEELISPGQYLS
jgi:hypothetical protein